jgi:uncharacterized SAM-binding protein YcdF (DUF218 family)
MSLPLRRPIARAVVVMLTILLLGILAGFPVYVRPQLDRLRHADVILVLGGYGNARYADGLELAEAHWAPNLVFSAPDGSRNPFVAKLCDQHHLDFALSCFVPDPGTTIGEARDFGALAAKHGWHSAIVVTYRPHISRARYNLHQCFAGDLIMVVSPPRRSLAQWAYEYAYQTAAFVRDAVQHAC